MSRAVSTAEWQGKFYGYSGKKPASAVVQHYWLTVVAYSRCHCVPSYSALYFALGRCKVQGSRESGQLVALSYRSAIFSGIPNGLASHTLPVLNTTFHAGGTTRDLDACGPFALRDDSGHCAIPVAAWKSCSHERIAMAFNTWPNARHHHRERSNVIRETPRHCRDQRLPGWSLHGLSRQCGILRGGLCSNARHSRFKGRFDYDAGHPVAHAPGDGLDFLSAALK